MSQKFIAGSKVKIKSNGTCGVLEEPSSYDDEQSYHIVLDDGYKFTTVASDIEIVDSPDNLKLFNSKFTKKKTSIVKRVAEQIIKHLNDSEDNITKLSFQMSVNSIIELNDLVDLKEKVLRYLSIPETEPYEISIIQQSGSLLYVVVYVT